MMANWISGLYAVHQSVSLVYACCSSCGVAPAGRERAGEGTHPRICSSDSGMSTYSCIISYTLWLFQGTQKLELRTYSCTAS